jgi:hypothetical protein
MRQLHPVFNVVKLTSAPADLIAGHRTTLPPPLEVVEGEEEYLVAEILDSKMFAADSSSKSSRKDTGQSTIAGSMQRMSMHQRE